VAARFLAEVITVLERIRRQHGGEEVRTVGNTLLSRFADPASALRAACGMHATADASRMAGMQPRLRLGVHCGEVTVHGRSVYGEAVSTAARLVMLCAPGQTLASAAVYECLSAVEKQCLRSLPTAQGWTAALGKLYEVVPGTGLDGGTAMAMPRDRDQHTNTRTLASHEAATGSRRLQLTRRHRKQVAEDGSGLASEGARLCLIRGPDIHVVNLNRPCVALGRESGNDIEVDSPAASRQHAHIEWRPDGFYLVDHSWNGTYVYDEKGRQTHVHNAECRLQDSGLVCLGCPGSHPEVDPLRFVEAR
jgi:hypothetical protein